MCLDVQFSFPVVKLKDEARNNGEHRTKRIIPDIYNTLGEAIRTGQPDQTRLDPPPGSPAEPLPVWNPGQPRPANWPTHIHPPKGCQT